MDSFCLNARGPKVKKTDEWSLRYIKTDRQINKRLWFTPPWVNSRSKIKECIYQARMSSLCIVNEHSYGNIALMFGWSFRFLGSFGILQWNYSTEKQFTTFLFINSWRKKNFACEWYLCLEIYYHSKYVYAGYLRISWEKFALVFLLYLIT